MRNNDNYDQQGGAFDLAIFSRILSYLLPYKRQVSQSVLLLMLISALQLLGPYLTKVAIDDYILPGQTDDLWQIATLYLAVLLVISGLKYLQIFLTFWAGQHAVCNLRVSLFAHIQRLSLRFYDKRSVGDIVARLTNDIQVIGELMTTGVVTIFQDIFFLVGIMIVMVAINWRLALVTYTVVPVLLVLSFIFKSKVRKTFRIITAKLGAISAYIQEHVSGIDIVQTHNRSTSGGDGFEVINMDYLQAYYKTIFYYGVFFPLVDLIGAVMVGLILWYGGQLHQLNGLELGVLIAFIEYSRKFYRPIADLSEKFSILQSAMASSERIFELIDNHDMVTRFADEIPFTDLQSSIEYQNVTFGYDPERPVIRNVSMTIPKGRVVAIVGATGSGKTTATSLLTRLYEYTAGQILIDGRPVTEYNLDDLRRRINVISQEVFLFSDTIYNNITLGDASISRTQVEDAARLTGVDVFISSLDAGYQTKLAERANNLSVGQRQLIALTRAFVLDPTILIMDEATANIDTTSELMIQSALAKVMCGRTSIIIAHRLSTIRNADTIMVFHEGALCEQGSHEELLVSSTIYRKLYEIQFDLAAV